MKWRTPPRTALSIRARLFTDRKSTRLNSSHVENSYAVYCLKKKMLNILADWPLWQLCQQQPCPEQIRMMPAVLTNQAYLLQLDSGDYVLRIASTSSNELDLN